MHLLENYGKSPLPFQINQGQCNSGVKFLARGNGHNVFLTNNEIVLVLYQSNNVEPEENTNVFNPEKSIKNQSEVKENTTNILRIKLNGSNPTTTLEGVEELLGKANYFTGNNPSMWHKNIATFNKVKYKEIYTGIDMVFYASGNQLEFDFLISPGSDPKDISLNFQGMDTLNLNETGDLILEIDEKQINLQQPLVYQIEDGNKKEIEASYILKENKNISFSIKKYDISKPLIIDPKIVYSTYLGGSSYNIGYDIAIDNEGNAYITGYNDSPDFPTKNQIQTYNGQLDVFVTKLNATGSSFIYSTYFGGSLTDTGNGIAVDSDGNAYVTGNSRSKDFPLSNPIQSFVGDQANIFVTKFSPDGSRLIYSTFLGGSNGEWGGGIAIDSNRNAYITGHTNSDDFPTKNPIQSTLGGISNAFVTKLNAAGSAIVYSTYIGGNLYTYGRRIAVDIDGNAYIVGYTTSNNFPTKNPIQSTLHGSSDGFICKLNSTGSNFIYATYIGGSANDSVYSIAVDIDGNAYITGSTSSSDFPISNPIQFTLKGTSSTFITKLNKTGTSLIYSTYLGGSNYGFGKAIAVNNIGEAYIAGTTSSNDFPIVNPLKFPSEFPLTTSSKAFICKLNIEGSNLVFSSCFGYGGYCGPCGLVVDNIGTAYIGGYAASTNLPAKDAIQPIQNGICDSFIMKIAMEYANLSITATASQYHVTIGNTITFMIKVTNDGPDTATDIELTNTLPKDLSFISAISSQGICNKMGDLITAHLGLLKQGEFASFTLVSLAIQSGTITNTTIASCYEGREKTEISLTIEVSP
jgi:uncharacterized repeat protein (TIGR01451 family)